MKKEKDTVVIACHLYRVDEQKFKAFCRAERRFHSEVLRELILGWIDLKSNLPDDLKSKSKKVKIFPDEKSQGEDVKIPDERTVSQMMADRTKAIDETSKTVAEIVKEIMEN